MILYERVKRRATKLLMRLGVKLNEVTTQYLGSFLWSHSRQWGDLIMYSILSTPDHTNGNILPEPQHSSSSGKTQRIVIQRDDVQVRSHFFLIQAWLAREVLAAGEIIVLSEDDFKMKLDKDHSLRSLPPIHILILWPAKLQWINLLFDNVMTAGLRNTDGLE